MRNPGGYGIVTSPVPTALRFADGRREYMRAGVFETDTYTCGHGFCGGRVVSVRPGEDPTNTGALCKKCMKIVCRHCVNLGRQQGITCDPLEAKIERAEARDRLRQLAGA